MKVLFWLIILAGLAVGVTLIAELNTGYAVFVVPPYRADISLNLFIVYLVLAVVILYLLVKLTVGMLSLPSKVQRWRERRKQVDARKQGYLGIMALIEGRMQRVEGAVEKALMYEKNPEARMVAALIGAKAAHIRRDFAQRDRYLHQLEAQEDKLNIAVAMLKAEMLADERNDQEALKVLDAVLKASPKLISAMRLELRIQQRLNNTIRVIELADSLERLEVFDSARAERIRHEAYLQQATKITSGKALKDWWSKLPRSAKSSPSIALVTVKGLVSFEDKLTAAQIIEETLDVVWDAALVDYYGRLGLHSTQLTSQLQKAEKWLKNYPNDAQLLLTLGRLCAASELWGKAQSYLEASLAVQSNAVTHAELGRLLEQLGQNEPANQHYRRSLELTIKL